MYELKEQISQDSWEDIQGSIDEMLSSFYTSRIGLRFLMEHHVKSRCKVPGVRTQGSWKFIIGICMSGMRFYIAV